MTSTLGVKLVWFGNANHVHVVQKSVMDAIYSQKNGYFQAPSKGNAMMSIRGLCRIRKLQWNIVG